MKKQPFSIRFWTHVNFRGPIPIFRPILGPCWIWTACVNSSGYGLVGDSHRKIQLSHRIAYELIRGHIPKKLQIDHLCRVRNCVNPWHLEVVTKRINQLRGVIAKTHCVNGHEYTKENTGMWKKTRYCRTCKRQANKKWMRLRERHRA